MDLFLSSQCPLLNISYCPPLEMDLSWEKLGCCGLQFSWLEEGRCGSNSCSSAITSTLHTSAGSENGTIEVGQGNLKLIYSTMKANLLGILIAKACFYTGSNGSDKDPQPAFFVSIIATEEDKEVQLSNSGDVKEQTVESSFGSLTSKNASPLDALLQYVKKYEELIESHSRLLPHVLNFVKAYLEFL